MERRGQFAAFASNTGILRHVTHSDKCRNLLPSNSSSSFLSYSDQFYLIVVGVKGYCCTWSHFMTQTHNTGTFGRNPLDERLDRRRDFYLTTHNIYKREISLPPAGFEPAIPARRRPQNHTLDRVVTGTSKSNSRKYTLSAKLFCWQMVWDSENKTLQLSFSFILKCFKLHMLKKFEC